MTNREFIKNGVFVKSCELAGVKATKRQASKFRAGKGRAVIQRENAFMYLAINGVFYATEKN